MRGVGAIAHTVAGAYQGPTARCRLCLLRRRCCSSQSSASADDLRRWLRQPVHLAIMANGLLSPWVACLQAIHSSSTLLRLGSELQVLTTPSSCCSRSNRRPPSSHSTPHATKETACV